MRMLTCSFMLLLVATSTLLLPTAQSQSCNEAVCASLVSKCMLLKSCECDLSDKRNCSCCKDCHRCLSKLYTECCSCVGLCTPPDSLYKDQLSSSTVDVLPDPIPDLYNVLTEEEDPEQRWQVFSYPAHLDLLYFKPQQSQNEVVLDGGSDKGHRVRHGDHDAFISPVTEYHNCSVAYMSQCMPLNKCRQACGSMGAARFRWFHAYGCCECIGDMCLDYGMGEPRCLQCPPEEEEDELFYTSDQRHYSLEEDFHNERFVDDELIDTIVDQQSGNL